MEDEVQYLGTFAPTAAPSDPTGPQRPITGIWLIQVQNYGDKPSHSNLYFYKRLSSVVEIGRTSSSATTDAAAPNCAKFRCPVMSRYHAKIVFTETGSVHLIDLKSHHGTYVLKQGDLTSVRLCPDVPVSLAHGDTVTFGKSVGRDQSIVRPVTVVVRLLYGPVPPLPAPPLPLAHAVASSWGPAMKSLKPFSSGRYGMYDALPDSPSSEQGESSSSSSDESTSSRDSDIEEIEPPEEYPIQRSEVTRGIEGSHLPPIRGLGLLGRFFPSVHAPQPTNVNSSPILSRQGSKHMWFYDDEEEEDIISYTPPGQVTSNSIVEDPQDENMANFLDILNGVRTPEPCLPSTNMPHVDPPVIGAYPLSRVATPAPSHSPEMMDPSPVAEPVVLEPSQMTPAPRTASPASDSDMDESSSQSDEDDAQESSEQHLDDDMNHAIVVEGNGEEQSMVIEAAPPSPLLVPQISATRTDLDNSSMDVAPTSTDTTVPNPASGKLASFEESLVNLRASVLRVNIAHRKTQADQKAQSDRAAALDKRIDETNAQYETLCDRIDGAYAHCDELRGELTQLGDGMKSFEERHVHKVTVLALNQVKQALATRPPAPTYEMLENALVSRPDVKSSVQALQTLVTELQTLKETTSKEIADELEHLRAVRAEAAAAAIASQSAAVPSLKRKRSEVDDADADDADAEHHAGVVHEGPPRAKRSRRVLRAAVHTAAAVTVGAVAAWSALAFA